MLMPLPYEIEEGTKHGQLNTELKEKEQKKKEVPFANRMWKNESHSLAWVYRNFLLSSPLFYFKHPNLLLQIVQWSMKNSNVDG